MRYRLASSMRDQRAQVLTPPALAHAMLARLSGGGHDWLELGSGTGRILDACFAIKAPREYVGFELDRKLLAQTPPHPGCELISADVLDPGVLDRHLGDRLFARAAGNPPYGMAALSPAAQDRLARLCPGLPQVKAWGQRDLYFVLETLARLSRPGEAAFIVGAPIAEDVRLTAFRSALLNVASEVECLELPQSCFGSQGAEVQSYVLVTRFTRRRSVCRVRVGRFSDTLELQQLRDIPLSEGTERLDYAFYAFQDLHRQLRAKHGTQTLGELGASIVRGSRTRDIFRSLNIDHFHTTDFPRDGMEVRFTKGSEVAFQVASSGDILLPRVGTRCLDRHALVTRGQRAYTESVYRVRLPAAQRTRVLNWVSSELGVQWRRAAAKGSCAKHVTVSSLLGMPVGK